MSGSWKPLKMDPGVVTAPRQPCRLALLGGGETTPPPRDLTFPHLLGELVMLEQGGHLLSQVLFQDGLHGHAPATQTKVEVSKPEHSIEPCGDIRWPKREACEPGPPRARHALETGTGLVCGLPEPQARTPQGKGCSPGRGGCVPQPPGSTVGFTVLSNSDRHPRTAWHPHVHRSPRFPCTPPPPGRRPHGAARRQEGLWGEGGRAPHESTAAKRADSHSS